MKLQNRKKKKLAPKTMDYLFKFNLGWRSIMVETWHWTCLEHQIFSELLESCLSLFLKFQRFRAGQRKRGDVNIKRDWVVKRTRVGQKKKSYISGDLVSRKKGR